ncbi:MAG: sugar-binding domain-containing protein [Verrucomicrobiales bacterium]
MVLAPAALAEVIDLSGQWRFELDGKDEGISAKWNTRELGDTVKLPGTTDENRKGIEQAEKPADRLMRPWFWKGPAWYQRDVAIPENWKDKRILLSFERTKNTRVWIGDTFAGRRDSLSAPHEFDVTSMIKAGKNTITVRIDNSKLPPVGPSHAVDERTQTNWNGILGKMELRAMDRVWIEGIRVFPDITKKAARVRVQMGNLTGEPMQGMLSIRCRSYNVEKPQEFALQQVPFSLKAGEEFVEFTHELGDGVPLWDEFSPALLRMEIALEANSANQKFAHQSVTRFAMRQFTRDGARLLNNGRQVFLRGRLDCANFPLTGYAPMGLEEWRRLLRITRHWGLNHWRFHSWCPPAAAFEAADELGFYFQVELPNKRSAFNAPDNAEAARHNIDYLDVLASESETTLYDFALRESDAIFRHFGNSPSFVMYTLGNELGRTQGMFDLIARFKRSEPGILMAQGSNNMHWAPSLAEGDDFWVTGKIGKDSKALRGSFSFFDFPDPHIESKPPSTMVDFSASIEGVAVPAIGHETGQFQVYPDFRDIPKFTGVLRARNYEIFRERLEKAGMLDQAADFVRASGALAAICYREDIEAALRTPGFGGFQLLDIMDFPGQGTALVGMLNVFMEEKGVVDRKKWLEFCSETVPLLRMEKYAWTSDETFSASVQVAHYGPRDLADATLTGELLDSQGKVLSTFQLPKATLTAGGIHDLGKCEIPIEKLGITAPAKLELVLRIKDTPHRNKYSIWIYPPEKEVKVPEGILVTRKLHDPATREHLEKGGKVLLVPAHDRLPRSVPGGFQCEFWSPMFAEAAVKRGEKKLPPGTLGFLCDPSHPALAAFPTEFHANWQWWHLLKNSRPIMFDGSPAGFRPILQMVDNFVRNHKLGLIAETKAGGGSVLISAIDLPGHSDIPEVRQMFCSLLSYMDSDAFAPKHELESALLKEIFPD